MSKNGRVSDLSPSNDNNTNGGHECSPVRKSHNIALAAKYTIDSTIGKVNHQASSVRSSAINLQTSNIFRTKI